MVETSNNSTKQLIHRIPKQKVKQDDWDSSLQGPDEKEESSNLSNSSPIVESHIDSIYKLNNLRKL